MPEGPLSLARLAETYKRRESFTHRWLRPPLPVAHNPAEALLPALEGRRLLIGGAGAPRRAGFFTVDLLAGPTVDLVCDAQRLSIRSDSVAAIECDAVLEHVREPRAVVSELERVLVTGGCLHVVVPFNHPFHAYPSDYHRWTLEGLRVLLQRFEIIQIGVRTGPTATLLTFLLEYVKILAPGPLKRPVCVAVAWLVWPLRGIDRWLNGRPGAHALANCLYALARKSPTPPLDRPA